MIVIKPITHSSITEFPLKLISTEIALDKIKKGAIYTCHSVLLQFEWIKGGFNYAIIVIIN